MEQQIYPDYPTQPMPMPVSSDEVYATELQREIVKNIVAQISPDNNLYEIEMRLRGYRKEITNNQWVKINPNGKEPHPELIERYISFLSSILNQGTSLSFLSEKQVNMIMQRCIEWIADDLDNNAELYGLDENFTERTRLGNLLLNPLFMVLCRAINGRESQRMFKAISLSESNYGEQKAPKKSFMDYLKL